MNATETKPTEPSVETSTAPIEHLALPIEQIEIRTRPFVRPWWWLVCLLAAVCGFVFLKGKPPRVALEAESTVAFSSVTESPAQGEGATNIVQLQPYRQTSSVGIRTDRGEEFVTTLVNLNPAMNVWYVLEIAPKNGASKLTYHLENIKPRSQKLALDEKFSSGIVILEGKSRYPCDLFAGGATSVLEQAKSSQLIYAGLCGGRVYLRNPAKGHRTTLEAATEFFRDQVWGGEKVIVLVHHLLQDSNRETGEIHDSSQAPVAGNSAGLPLPARIDPKYAGQLMSSPNLEISLSGPRVNGTPPGTWTAVRGIPGVYVSLLRPNFVAPEILQGDKALVSSLDSVEASALAYLVAFDLDQFDMAFALGTQYPGVGWSDHMLEQARDRKLAGPDGIASIAPLVSTGLINPEDARTTVAAFTGGFKRTHGAFKAGELAMKNHGSHYGFVENGVVFSKLQPGLSTIFVRTDGYVGMQTWNEAADKLLPGIKYARQNGVPLIEFDGASQSGVPGQFVNRWGPGNWSGSEDAKLRTMRSGLAMQQSGAKRFLIYAVFTTATPSAMVRVFQAYQCRYAMLLDMNALEHTYLALYQRTDSHMVMQHLISGMGEVDKSGPDGPIPRFLGFPDNRDFFYVLRRNK